MVNEGIVLGHKISERGIEVDKAKVDLLRRCRAPRTSKVYELSLVMLDFIGGSLRTSQKFLGL